MSQAQFSRRTLKVKTLSIVVAALLAACGGGSDDTAATVPPLSATRTLLNGTQIGTARWANANTATGGQGQPIDGISCVEGATYRAATHLSIFLNGAQVALPSNIGLVGACDYELHTHNLSGVISIEAAAARDFTVGQLFSVWGMALSNTNVGDISNPNMVVYVNDSAGGNGTAPSKTPPYIYTGDVRQLKLAQYREITIQLGTPLQELPAYDWSLFR